MYSPFESRGIEDEIDFNQIKLPVDIQQLSNLQKKIESTERLYGGLHKGERFVTSLPFCLIHDSGYEKKADFHRRTISLLTN